IYAWHFTPAYFVNHLRRHSVMPIETWLSPTNLPIRLSVPRIPAASTNPLTATGTSRSCSSESQRTGQGMTHFSIEPDAYLHLARTPITAETPCGTDVRYSPEYEQLEQEVGKSGALHGTGEIDWERVRGGCETLLREQSRDLRVAAWLTWGLYQQHGLTG